MGTDGAFGGFKQEYGFSRFLGQRHEALVVLDQADFVWVLLPWGLSGGNRLLDSPPGRWRRGLAEVLLLSGRVRVVRWLVRGPGVVPGRRQPR